MKKIIKDYAHDYRDMAMSEIEIETILTNFLNDCGQLINDEDLYPYPQFSPKCREWHKLPKEEH